MEFATDGLNIQKLYIKSCIILFVVQELLKKLYCTCLLTLYLLYMDLNYSINNSKSFHLFFSVAAMFLHAKITIYFNFERKGLCLQTLCMPVNIHLDPTCRGGAITPSFVFLFV